jgi:hypothetical protein
MVQMMAIRTARHGPRERARPLPPAARLPVNHPLVGWLDLDFESMELPSEPGLRRNVYTAAAAGTPSTDALKLLGSCAASQAELPTEAAAR